MIRRDYGPAGACQRKAAVSLLVLLSVIAAVVWGGYELLAVALFAPWWVRAGVTAVAVVGGLIGWRLRVAVGRLEAMVDEEAPR
jgi:hypothetical protein